MKKTEAWPIDLSIPGNKAEVWPLDQSIPVTAAEAQSFPVPLQEAEVWPMNQSVPVKRATARSMPVLEKEAEVWPINLSVPVRVAEVWLLNPPISVKDAELWPMNRPFQESFIEGGMASGVLWFRKVAYYPIIWNHRLPKSFLSQVLLKAVTRPSYSLVIRADEMFQQQDRLEIDRWCYWCLSSIRIKSILLAASWHYSDNAQMMLARTFNPH